MNEREKAYANKVAHGTLFFPSVPGLSVPTDTVLRKKYFDHNLVHKRNASNFIRNISTKGKFTDNEYYLTDKS